MPAQETITSSRLYQKLPKQHKIIRYGGLFILALIVGLLLSLYYIKIPSFFLVELHPLSNSKQLIAVCPKVDQLKEQVKSNKEITMTLENGKQALFNITEINEKDHYLHLILQASNLNTQDHHFLETEYISTAKIHKTPQPLIWSLISL